MDCLFVSDLHGATERYEKLWRMIESEAPDAVFLGGDLLPSGLMAGVPPPIDDGDFVEGFLARGFESLRRRLGRRYPAVFLILGNDDPRAEEAGFVDVACTGLWVYAHGRTSALGDYSVLGYAHVPPSPFLLKDWERYDVSRFVPPGCVSPEEGRRSLPVPENEVRYSTIEKDLQSLCGDTSLDRTICLFHTPPHETALDRVANDGKFVDHVPLDLHVGSIAVQRFIERRQPLLTLHGHIHESARLTGRWRDHIGKTPLFGAAHDGPELALIRFRPENLEGASRELV